MTIYHEFQPTYLYIKEHSLTGMKYLGKTTKPDPDAYLGSGTYWRRHIKTHGKEHVVTVWKQLFTDRESLVEAALRLSDEHNVVKSDSWANLTIENGLDGISTGAKFSDEHRSNISKTHKGLVRSAEHRLNISKANKGKKRSEASKQKARERFLVNNPTHKPEVRDKISAAKTGKPRPDLSERNRIRWEKYRQAQSHQVQAAEISV